MKLRVAYSPDADDAFMFFGLDTGAVVADGLTLERETADIETLNRRALAAELDLTAISFAAWPRLSEHYDLLTVGSSFGLGTGPKLVARPDTGEADVLHGRVAVPGELTTARLLLALRAPEAEPVVVPFEEIADAVTSGSVAGGVVIHEAQLTYAAAGLALVTDLGAWWSETTGGLPVPLGANVVRRALGPDVGRRLAQAMAASIRHALENRVDALRHAMPSGRGLDAADADEYVATYVNELSLDPGLEGRKAVDELFRLGSSAGLLPPATARWVG